MRAFALIALAGALAACGNPYCERPPTLTMDVDAGPNSGCAILTITGDVNDTHLTAQSLPWLTTDCGEFQNPWGGQASSLEYEGADSDGTIQASLCSPTPCTAHVSVKIGDMCGRFTTATATVQVP